MLVFSQALPFPNDGSVEQPGLHERIQYLKRVPMYKNRIDFRSIVDMYDPVLFALFSSLIGWRQFQAAREISRLAKQRIQSEALSADEIAALRGREKGLIATLQSLRDENTRRSVLCGTHKSPVGLEEWLGHLSGQVRALEFALPVLQKEKAHLSAQVVTSTEKYSILREEYDRLNVELRNVRQTVLDEELILRKLEESVDSNFPSDLDSLIEKIISKREKVATLKERLTETDERETLEKSVAELRAQLLANLVRMEAHQAHVCEKRMDQLTAALDREEVLLEKARGNGSLEELDTQQELLVSLHADLKKSNEKRNFLEALKLNTS